MSNFVELEPSAFVLACRHSNFKVSVEATSYLSQIATSNTLLSHLEVSHALWLQSPGRCQFQICIEKDDTRVDDRYTLEHIATTIVSCQLWAELSLLAEIEEIHFDALEKEPNIYLTVEHHDKSNALLAPNHMERAQFVGLQCLLNFQGDICVVNRPTSSQTAPGSSPSTIDTDDMDADELWDRLDDFITAALRELVGGRKQLLNMKKTKLSPGPSLIETAPAVWNANYLESIADHAKQLSLISTILASCTQAQNPSLRNKTIAMVDSQQPSSMGNRSTESAMQKLLWEQVLENTKSLQTKPRTASKKTTKTTPSEEGMDIVATTEDRGIETQSTGNVYISQQETVNIEDTLGYHA